MFLGAGLAAAGPIAQLAATCNRHSLGLILPAVITSESTSCTTVVGSYLLLEICLNINKLIRRKNNVGGGGVYKEKVEKE